MDALWRQKVSESPGRRPLRPFCFAPPESRLPLRAIGFWKRAAPRSSPDRAADQPAGRAGRQASGWDAAWFNG